MQGRTFCILKPVKMCQRTGLCKLKEDKWRDEWTPWHPAVSGCSHKSVSQVHSICCLTPIYLYHSPLYHPITEIMKKKNSHSEHHRLLLLLHCSLTARDILFWLLLLYESRPYDQDEPCTCVLYVVLTPLREYGEICCSFNLTIMKLHILIFGHLFFCSFWLSTKSWWKYLTL